MRRCFRYPWRILLAGIVLCHAPSVFSEDKRGGLTEEEFRRYLEIKEFVPKPGEGFRAWFFDFGNKKLEVAYTKVDSSKFYSKEQGWGWVYDRNHIRLTDHAPNPNLPYGYGYSGHNYRRPFARKYHIFTPLEMDMVGVFRAMGVGASGLPDGGDISRTLNGAQYVKDDLTAEFVVDIPKGDYSGLVEVHPDNYAGDFFLQIEGESYHRFQSRGNVKHKFAYVPVNDGQLNIRFIANRLGAASYAGGSWGIGPGWNIGYLAIFQAKDEKGFLREDWRIIKNKFYTIKKEVYVSINRLQARINENYIVVDERPYFNVNLQNHSYPYDGYLKFYSLGNSFGGGGALSTPLSRLFKSNNFLASDRHERAYYEDYPYELVNAFNVGFNNTMFGRPFFGGQQLEFMPKYLQGESPLMSSPDGRSLGRAPIGSKLQRELIIEFLEFLSAHMSDHPGLIAYELWEELEDMPGNFGYDSESIGVYQQWLKKKYGDINALNAKWQSQYGGFDEIQPPLYKAYGGANYTNWYNFRGLSVGDDLRLCHEKIDELQPWTLSMGGRARPTTGDDSTWDWLPAVDVYYESAKWFTKQLVAAQKYFRKKGHAIALIYKEGISVGKTPGAGSSRPCPLTHSFRGVYRKSQRIRRRSSPYRTKQETQKAIDGCNGYVDIIRSIFEGGKGIMYEAQDRMADMHMFHFAKHYADTLAKPGGEFRTEYNDLIWFSEESLRGPPVRLCVPYLFVPRAVEFAYRTAPVILPAEVPETDVCLVALAESTFPVADSPAGGAARKGGSNFRASLANLSRLFESLQVPVGGVREDIFDDIFRYKMIVLGPAAAAITSEQAEKVKQFVQKGGYLIILNHGCSMDGDTMYSKREAPLFGLDALVGGKAVKEETDGWAVEEILPDMKESVTFKYRAITPLQGATVLKKDDEGVKAVRSENGRCFYIMDKRFGQGYYRNFGEEGKGLREILSAILKDLDIRRWVSVEGAKKPWDLYTGMLKGKDYWIFGVTNRNLDKQDFRFRIQCLPAGNYSILDVTGQRPIIKHTREKSWYLEKDPAYLQERFLSRKISTKELAQKGIPLDCLGRAGRILLVRPAAADLWVNMPEYEMVGLTFQYHRKNPKVDKRLDARPDKVPVKIVLGTRATSTEKSGADAIMRILKAKGVAVSLVRDQDIKVKKTETKIAMPISPGRRVKETYVMDVFHHEIIDDPANLLVIGNEATNTLAGQLARKGSYVYDKVMVKVSDKFPGKGIGVIQVAESINNEGYDPRHVSRSAILIGGSDDAGCKKAIDHFVGVMKKGAAQNPKKVAERYGFGLEKRPVYITARVKK